MRCTIKTSCFLGTAYSGIAPVAAAVASAGSHADYSQRASAYHLRGSMVPVEGAIPAWAAMNTLEKFLGSDAATSRTFLRRAIGIH